MQNLISNNFQRKIISFARLKDGPGSKRVCENFLKCVLIKNKGDITSKTELAMFVSHVFFYSQMLQRTSEIDCMETECPGAMKRWNLESLGQYYPRGYLPLVSN